MAAPRAICKGCRQEMSEEDWQVHLCPGAPRPKKGEPMSEYYSRLQAFLQAQAERNAAG